MCKVDGMKVYVFCYSFGYVVAFAERGLNVISVTPVITPAYLYEMTGRPEVMFGEVDKDGKV